MKIQRFLAVLALVALLEPIQAVGRDTDRSVWLQAAEKHDVEPLVLYAVALVESKRSRPDGFVRPWPWTLHTPEEGALYFDSYASALAKLEQLIAAGEAMVDVGIMQVNWHFNGHLAEHDAERLLMPAHNIEIAARLLREHLTARKGDLKYALARYHSSRIDRGLAYAEFALFILRQLQGMAELEMALTRR